MEYLDNENVLAIVRPNNDAELWFGNELQVRPQWKTQGLVHNCVAITLQDRPFTSAGVVFGTGRDCEVVIAEKEDSVPEEGMSFPDMSPSRTFEECHFSIGLDHQYRLVARDLTDGQGIRVRYNGFENSSDVRNAEWILAGPGVPDRYRQWRDQLEPWRLTIVVQGQTLFDILPGKALQGLRARGMQAQLFRQGKDPKGPLSRQVPVTVPRYLNDGETVEHEVGGGGFGIVKYCWNPFTSKEYVVKRPHPDWSFDREQWRQEARILDLARHPHIVEFMGANFDTTPCIAMEHVALGALQHQEGITRIEALIILRQCTSTLSFLHGHQPAIIHRDIKPHNILVQQRGEGGANGSIVVKLCDFGLIREIFGKAIISKPGTERYFPPEYYPVGGYEPRLGVGMDMWSLGLTIFELVRCTLPSDLSTSSSSPIRQWGDDNIIPGTPMHHQIVSDLHQFAENENQADFSILKRMLVLDSVQRITAKEAHELAEAMDISAFELAQTVTAAAIEPGTAAAMEYGTATAMEHGTVVGQAQPLVDQAESTAEDMSGLSISGPRPAKRKRGNY